MPPIAGAEALDQLDEALKRLGLDDQPRAPILVADPSAGLRIGVAGVRAIDVWEALHGAAEETGFWPVVLGGEDELRASRRNIEIDPRSTAAILDKASRIDGRIWLEEHAAESARYSEELTAELRAKGYDVEGEESKPPRGPWPVSPRTSHGFLAHLSRHPGLPPHPTVYIGLVPTRRGFEVPAFLRFGGWNGCPMPENQVAVLRSWRDRFGAELVSLTDDALEMAVARPPTHREAALNLAVEQYWYCEDLCNLAAVDTLAASLLGGTSWLFWWD